MSDKKKIVGKISRRYTAMFPQFADMIEYDRIRNMEWDGIPNLKDEDYYVEYIDTAGRDVIQQATNVYATQRPKWDVLPRGKGDIETAEEMERIIEWYFWRAMQSGVKPFNSEAMEHIGVYNKVCGQLEWMNGYWCAKQYNPQTVVYEFGAKLQWVAVVNNVLAADVIEKFSDYAKPGWLEKLTKGDDIGSALKKIQALVDDDEEQRVMYVDYTDEKTRYTYCYPVTNTEVDDTFGFSDDGTENEDFIVIQDKENSLGFINWAIAENAGDPLLAPLLKGRYYDNINDLETMKATNLFRRGLFPMFKQEGREDADAEIDYGGSQIVIKTPNGARLEAINPPPIDPGYNEMSAQMRQKMNQSLAIHNVSQASVSNVQHSTYDAQVKMWLMQYEPNKRTAEKYFEQLATLMFKWAKKENKVLKALRMYSKKNGLQKGAEVAIEPDQINLDALYIKCRIFANNPNDMMQITNQISMMKQAGIRIPDREYIEQFDMGDPELLGEEYEKQEIRAAALEAQKTKILGETQNMLQQQMAEFNAELELKMQQANQAMQMEAQQMAMQQQPQPSIPGQVAPQQGMPLPSDQATSGQGFNAGMGGGAPQAATPEITQAMR